MPKLVRDKTLVTDDSWQNEAALRLAADCDLSSIEIDYANTPTIVIEFGAFTDGRAFSLARTLREQLDYTGELRAAGSFIPDQLHYLSRCGFNAFEFSDDTDERTIEECFAAFSEHYQAAADDPQPLFRKRA